MARYIFKRSLLLLAVLVIMGGDWGVASGAEDQAVADPFAAVNARMHREMAVAPSGNVDVDFMRGMIPHHQGAVEMAEILLKEGKDPETRALAESIVKNQKAEIAMMKAWLEKHAPDAAPAVAPTDRGGHHH